MKNIVLAVGGTGGHIYPAVALADYIRTCGRDDVTVQIFGAAGGAEERIAQRHGIAFKGVKVVKLPGGKLSPGAVRLPLDIAASVAEAKRSLAAAGAGAVIGFGGYVSFPTAAAARLLGLPVFLHEQNSVMGKSNRLLGRIAKAVFTSFDETSHAPAGRVIHTGNPCRFEGAKIPSRDEAVAAMKLDGGRKTLFVFGGSQGAASLNRAAVKFAKEDSGNAALQILHIAGPKNYEPLMKEYEKAVPGDSGLKVKVLDYCENMDAAYIASDLAVCRAGASTIFELMCLGVAAVLVPYPFATEGHQERNAEFLCGRGAAVMMKDSELDAKFSAEVSRLISNDTERAEIAAKCHSMFRPGAAERMAAALIDAARDSNSGKRLSA